MLTYRKTVNDDSVREWRLSFDSPADRDQAFDYIMEAKRNGESIYTAWKGVCCEFEGKVLFNDSDAIFIVCTRLALDGLEEEWAEW